MDIDQNQTKIHQINPINVYQNWNWKQNQDDDDVDDEDHIATDTLPILLHAAACYATCYYLKLLDFFVIVMQVAYNSLQSLLCHISIVLIIQLQAWEQC